MIAFIQFIGMSMAPKHARSNGVDEAARSFFGMVGYDITVLV